MTFRCAIGETRRSTLVTDCSGTERPVPLRKCQDRAGSVYHTIFDMPWIWQFLIPSTSTLLYVVILFFGSSSSSVRIFCTLFCSCSGLHHTTAVCSWQFAPRDELSCQVVQLFLAVEFYNQRTYTQYACRFWKMLLRLLPCQTRKLFRSFRSCVFLHNLENGKEVIARQSPPKKG